MEGQATENKIPTYWIARRTVAATEKDKWLECSNCGHMINTYDIERLRFEYPNDHGEAYRKEMKERYCKCEECGSEMDTLLTGELRHRRIAKGDYDGQALRETIKEIMAGRSYAWGVKNGFQRMV